MNRRERGTAWCPRERINEGKESTMSKPILKSREDALRPKWSALHAERNALFQQILKHLCVQHGHAELSALNDEAVKALTLEAEELVEKYDEADVDRHPQMVTGLRRALREHHEIGERIIDIQDDIALGA